MSRTGALAVLALSLAPAAAAALEPRYDHRDQQGVLLEAGAGRDTITAAGSPISHTGMGPSLALGYAFDVDGIGDELVLGARARFGSPYGSAGASRAAGLCATFRGFYGTEELKSFFEIGLVAPVWPRWSVGPRAGFGAIYDWSRRGGVFARVGFGATFGALRVDAYDASAGVELRWGG